MTPVPDMAYVPGFKYDVFISYAWVNNQSADDRDGESGWVTQFCKRLRRGLDEKLGRIGSSSFFFDEAGMARERDFNPQIEAALKSSATMMVLFSDGYLQSKACCDEMRLFNELTGAAHSSGRVFLVRIDDVPQHVWPDNFRKYFHNVLGYEFFRKHDRGLVLRLDFEDNKFKLEYEILRKSLSLKLKAMKLDAEKKPPLPVPVQPTVLIGQTTPDPRLRAARKALFSHCESAQLTVLPQGNYPSSPEKFRELFQQHLTQAHVFVHLLTDAYSDRTEEFPDGFEGYQDQMARAANVTILRWRDAAIDLDAIDDAAHRQFITAPDVRSDLPSIFFQAVVEAAQSSFQIARDAVHGGGNGKSVSQVVLVRADENDSDATREMVTRLAQANIGCRVARNGVPLVDRLRKIPFDALIVILGQCSPLWIEEQGDELLAVDLNMKDQTPLRAYCHAERRRVVPPYVGGEMLDLITPDELDPLIQAIHARKVNR